MSLVEFMERAGERETGDTEVQKAYQKLLEEDDIASIRWLIDFSGIEPRIDVDELQKKYLEYALSVEHFHKVPNDINRLVEMTGVQAHFDEGQIRDINRHWLFQARFEELDTILEIIGRAPNYSCAQELFFHYLNQCKFDSIEELAKRSGKRPQFSEGFVKGKMKEYLLENCWVHGVKRLHDITEILPDEQDVVTAYRSIADVIINKKGDLNRSWSNKYKLGALIELSDLTQVDVPEDIVQDLYLSFFNGQYYHERKPFQQLLEFTGVRPDLPDDHVHKIIMEHSKMGYYNEIKGWEEILGRKLVTEEIVYDAFAELLPPNNSMYNSASFKGIMKIVKLSSLSPPYELVQQRYKEMMIEGHILLVDELQQLTGIQAEIDDSTAHQSYNHAAVQPFHSVDGLKFSIQVSRKFFKITPIWDHEAIQSRYQELFDEENYGSMGDIHRVTGIQPRISAEAVQAKYIKHLSEGKVYRFSTIESLTGIKPGDELYRSLLESLPTFKIQKI